MGERVSRRRLEVFELVQEGEKLLFRILSLPPPSSLLSFPELAKKLLGLLGEAYLVLSQESKELLLVVVVLLELFESFEISKNIGRYAFDLFTGDGSQMSCV